MTGFGAMLAPAVGPVLGGYFVDYASWRLVFDINVPIGLLTAAGAWVLLPRTGSGAPPRFDRLGFVTIALGLFAVLLAASKGDSWGWDGYRIRMLIVAGALLLALFAFIELEAEHPLLDVRLLAIGQFSTTLFVTTVAFVNLLVGTFYVPVFLQHGQGYNAFTSGELILPQALVMLVTIPLSGLLYERVGPRVLGGAGFSLIVIGDAFFCGMTPDMTRTEIIAWTCFRGAGIGIGVMPIMTWGISRVSSERNNQANALFNVAQQVGGALCLAALGTFITTRQADVMAARTNLLGPHSELARRAGPILARGMPSDSATFAGLYRLAMRLQADVLAVTYREMFIVLGGLTAIAGVLTTTLRENRAPRGTAQSPVQREQPADPGPVTREEGAHRLPATTNV